MSPQFLIIIVLVFGLLWFLRIRPQKRRQLEQQDALNKLAPGTEILTAGGMYGTVRSVDGDDVNVEISPGTEIRLAKRAVAAVIPPESEEGEAEELEAGEDSTSHTKYRSDAADESTREKRS